MARLVLAATLAANYGIYGPAFELLEHVPREPGGEEYLDSEKYELRHWDLRPRRTAWRRSSRASTPRGATTRRCRATEDCAFMPTDNDRADRLRQGRAATDSAPNAVLVVVNLDPHHVQSGWVTLDLDALGIWMRASRSRCTTC